MVDRCSRQTRYITYVSLCEGIDDCDIPHNCISSRPWIACRSIRSLTVITREADRLLHSGNLSSLYGPSNDVIQVCFWCLAALFRQERSCKPFASTNLPQGHVCGTQVLAPSCVPTDTRIILSASLSPTAVMGGTWSQSPVFWEQTCLIQRWLSSWQQASLNNGGNYPIPRFLYCTWLPRWLLWIEQWSPRRKCCRYVDI